MHRIDAFAQCGTKIARIEKGLNQNCRFEQMMAAKDVLEKTTLFFQPFVVVLHLCGKGVQQLKSHLHPPQTHNTQLQVHAYTAKMIQKLSQTTFKLKTYSQQHRRQIKRKYMANKK
jgi:hypothetical protein